MQEERCRRWFLLWFLEASTRGDRVSVNEWIFRSVTRKFLFPEFLNLHMSVYFTFNEAAWRNKKGDRT